MAVAVHAAIIQGMVHFAARSAGAVLAGAPNFRDLGGYEAADGRRVRHGRVFRSGHLGRLVPEDIELLSHRLGPRVRVIDLRGSEERVSAPCTLPGASVHSLPFEPAVAKRLEARTAQGLPLTADATRQFMHDAYRTFVRQYRPQLAAFFGHVLALEDDEPLVVHCAAGKDRTGLACALLLSALGVPRDTVMDDYLHTAERFPYQPRAGRFPLQVMQVIAATEAGFLDAALGAIDEDFGGVEGYLREGLGLTNTQFEELRDLLLEASLSLRA
jgi:protein-tyrosine phosphatase